MSDNIINLHYEHNGKISDKWYSYLAEWNQIFSPYRKDNIRLLEIGVQNGGSLEIWGKYFTNAARIIGCDIEKKCQQLEFDDPKISVIIDDINSDECEKKILQQSDFFNIIIDDGSHKSGDIIKSFTRYFPHLNENNGIYLIEDLHCSYWKDFDGGLFYPYSAISFFKRLADIINFEHWRQNIPRRNLLKNFESHLAIEFDELELARIHSIQFINSLCIIKKSTPEENVLGKRLIAGVNETITSGWKKLNNTSINDILVSVENDTTFEIFNLIEGIENLKETVALNDKESSKLQSRIAEMEQTLIEQNETNNQQKQLLENRNQEVFNIENKIKELTAINNLRNREIEELNQVLVNCSEKISDLEKSLIQSNDQIIEHQQNIKNQTEIIRDFHNTRTWRYTKPLRKTAGIVRQIRNKYSKSSNVKNECLELTKNVEVLDLALINNESIFPNQNETNGVANKVKTVDVVIPVHNSVHWLAWCLEELFRFESLKLQNVFVVDDRSESDQFLKIKEIISRYSRVTLICNEVSESGFGVACNLGAKACTSDVILFLNTDCLLTEGLIDRLSESFEASNKIVLACPFSNNSPNLTYPMIAGYSYQEMARLFAQTTRAMSIGYILEVCTVVGNCLMVRRDFFEEEGGFSSEWGVGYGEETDLHLKAFAKGLKGVINTGCYVYHFGGGTFNYENEIESHKKKNHNLFIGKWEKEYKALASRCKNIEPTKIINNILKIRETKNNPIHLDMLFYLPGISQAVGGINAVIAICNELIRKGLKVTCALIGNENARLDLYKEPVLFNFVLFNSDEEFLSDKTLFPKIVFSTIFHSGPTVAKFASQKKAIPIQFVQGYEGFFENGTRFFEATESYKSTQHLVTTSDWLYKMVSRHLMPNQQLSKLPLVVNKDIFFSSDLPRPFDVILIFRSSPDKGQWVLSEILDRLVESNKNIAVLCSPEYFNLRVKFIKQVQFIELPIDQYSLAKILRQGKVFVDASLHEGYGLVPLEAALCGCNLVLSDSGGVREYAEHFNAKIITQLLDVDRFIEAINLSLEDFEQREFVDFPLPPKNPVNLWFDFFQKIVSSQFSETKSSLQTTFLAKGTNDNGK